MASKHERPQWLTMDEAIEHCTKGIDILSWASNDKGKPDIILACAGDTPTLEVLAATSILKKNLPDLKVRVINVVDLFKLESNKDHPHGLTDTEYNKLFPTDVPVLFNFHGYPSLIHQLTYKRDNHENIHVRGYNEEGTITTPFDMRVQNKIDRFNVVISALKYVDIEGKDIVTDWCKDKLNEHKLHTRKYGSDIEEVVNWKWED